MKQVNKAPLTKKNKPTNFLPRQLAKQAMGGLDARWVRGRLQTAATDDSIKDEATDSSSGD
jgi:hypothetical protein